ncbi:hypothetical protein ACFOEK_12165 [Litoribrevibacter euphylliae]|uniref:Uncharacterized protein n=1 Tax=Litoribrevibacter euphylliae TaxID=1834034 RepID=A0ABV7HD20_9GAMM
MKDLMRAKLHELMRARLLVERSELLEKNVKLFDFLQSEDVKGIDEEHVRLLWEQFDHMNKYSIVLGKRIDLLTSEMGEDK